MAGPATTEQDKDKTSSPAPSEEETGTRRGYADSPDRMTFLPVANALRGKRGKDGSGFDGDETMIAAPLEASDGHHGYSSPRGDGADNLIASTMKGQRGKGGGGVGPEETLVAAPLSHGSNPNSNMAGRRREDDFNLVADEMATVEKKSRCQADHETYVVEEPYTFDWQAGGGNDESWRGKSRTWIDDKPGTARALTSNKTLAVHDQRAYSIVPESGQGADLRAAEIDQANTIAAANEGQPGYDRGTRIAGASGVRRLTPVECERLQGLPDGWTDPDGSAADSRRYAALGDAVTANVAEWIGQRLINEMRKEDGHA